MGYYGKIEEKLIAQRLRKRGYSYRQILTKIKVSKDTISRWCRDISLTEAQKIKLINNKMLGQKKGSLVAADNKRRARIKESKEIFEKSKKELGKVNGRDKFITGIALYAAEGDKAEGNAGLANSDPIIIKFMMEWFNKFCKLPMSKYRGAIWLHEENDEVIAKKFWSKLTGIPINQFYKTYIVKRKRGVSVRKNIHPYGVFSINFLSTNTQRRILGWISALLNGKIPKSEL